MNDKQFYDKMREIILDVIRNEGLLIQPHHHGVVSEVTTSTKLKVFVDGSTTAQSISCNPDIAFNVGDNVWVTYINNNPRNKFIFSKRTVQ